MHMKKDLKSFLAVYENAKRNDLYLVSLVNDLHERGMAFL